MAWWNPRSWFNKKRVPAPESPFVWVKLNPANPAQGFDHYSTTTENPWYAALRVTGITDMEARSLLVGKVLDWNRLTPEQLEVLESQKALPIEYETLKGMFR